jgi:hypothetical protein
LFDKTTLRRTREVKNDTKVRNPLKTKVMIDRLSALECAKCELFAKSSDIAENKGDGG